MAATATTAPPALAAEATAEGRTDGGAVVAVAVEDLRQIVREEIERAVAHERPLLLTVEEVGQMLGISRRQVHRQAAAGELPAPVRHVAGSGSCTRWVRSQIVAYVDGLAAAAERERSALAGKWA